MKRIAVVVLALAVAMAAFSAPALAQGRPDGRRQAPEGSRERPEGSDQNRPKGVDEKRYPDHRRAIGKVLSVNGQTFTLKTRNQGEVKVVWNDNTQFINGKPADIKVGVFLGAGGKKTENVLHADKIAFRRHGPRHHVIRGEVVTVGETSFTMLTRRGEVTVHLNSGTEYRNGKRTDIKVGAKLGVIPVRCEKEVGAATPTDPGAEAKLCLRDNGAGASAEAGDAKAGAKAKLGVPKKVTAKVVIFPTKDRPKPTPAPSSAPA